MIVYYVNPQAKHKDIRLNKVFDDPLQFNDEYEVDYKLGRKLLKSPHWSTKPVENNKD